MTREIRKTDREMTNFSKWIRVECKKSSEGLVLSDVDFLVFDYKNLLMMMIEEKRFGTVGMEYSQNITLRIVDECFRETMIGYPGEYLYLGFYVVLFSNTGPDDSDIRIKDVKRDIVKPVTKTQLMSFINFETRFDDLPFD